MERKRDIMGDTDNLSNARKYELFSLLSDCSHIDEGQLTKVIVELSRRLTEKVTDRDKLIFTLLACSEDQKQRSFGLDMIIDFVPKDELDKYWTAVYYFAQAPAGEKNIAKMSAATRVMVPQEEDREIEDVFSSLSHKHEAFLETFSQIKTTSTERYDDEEK